MSIQQSINIQKKIIKDYVIYPYPLQLHSFNKFNVEKCSTIGKVTNTSYHFNYENIAYTKYVTSFG